MITGFDSVVVAARPPGPAMARFLAAWSSRWPDMRVAVGDPDATMFVPWRDTHPEIPTVSGEIMVARDEHMAADWDEHGYRTPNSTAGPFCVLYQPCPAREFSALANGDPYARDPAFPFEPYPVTVVGTGLWLVTVVTPDADSGFSRSVVEAVVAALTGSG